MIAPYGGVLSDRLVRDSSARADARRRMVRAVPVALSSRSLADLELLATGAFSPLDTFMGKADYLSVLDTMRLANGVVYPIPVTLPVPDSAPVAIGGVLSLLDRTGEPLALMTVAEVFERAREGAAAVCGTADQAHPLVDEMAAWPRRYASGPIEVLALPRHYTFQDLRLTPRQLRADLADRGWPNVVAFQTRNPMHRVHEELTRRAVATVDGGLLIHPVVGLTRAGDVDAFTRVLCYRELVSRHYDARRTALSVLPLAMRMAGPREAVWHAIIRRNFGATHFIVGRDHAGAGLGSNGRPFYGPYAAQQLVERFEPDIGVRPIMFEELAYAVDEDRYVERSQLDDRAGRTLSGTDVRQHYLAACRPLPDWFTRPEIGALLSRASVRARHGFCVWLRGGGDGESHGVATALELRLEEHGRTCVVLGPDQDVEDLGRTASDAVEQGYAVLCLSSAPVASVRRSAVAQIGESRTVLADIAEVHDASDDVDLRLGSRHGGVDATADVLLDYIAAMGFLPAAPTMDRTQHGCAIATPA